MKAKNPVVWFEIYVDDLKRAQKFYEKVLGVKMSELPVPEGSEAEMQMIAFPMEMEGVGAAGALVKMEGFKAGKNSSLIYFRSEDCTTEENRIEAAGGKVVQPKHAIGEYGFISLVTDTEGNMFGLHADK